MPFPHSHPGLKHGTAFLLSNFESSRDSSLRYDAPQGVTVIAAVLLAPL